MSNWLIVIAAGLAILMLLSRVNIYIDIWYRRLSGDDHILVKVYMLRRFVVYTMTVPVVEITKHANIPLLESEIKTTSDKIETYSSRERRFLKKLTDMYISEPRRWRQLFKQFHYYRRLIYSTVNTLTRSIYCERLSWRVSYGSEDAAFTGVITGVIWAISGSILTTLKKRISFEKKPEVKIYPNFNKPGLEVELRCIFRMTVGNVITTSFNLFNIKRKGAAGNG